MRAGQLRQRVTIQEKDVTRDTHGAEEITWTDLATVWAAVEPLTGREWIEGRQETAGVSTRIRIRYRSGITPEMRVSFGDITFNILSVIHVQERERELHLMCREIVEYG